MIHAITADGQLLTCPVCQWRGVLTSDGRIVQTSAGDAGHDHIGQAQILRDRKLAERQQVTEATMDRLRRQYSEHTPLPSGAELSLNQLQRLYRAVMGEHAL